MTTHALAHEEPICGDPCRYDPEAEDMCDDCAEYWRRMEAEGLWKDGRWTDKGMRKMRK